MKKKILCLMLALTLSVGCFTACGSETKESGSESKSESPAASDEDGLATVTPAQPEEDISAVIRSIKEKMLEADSELPVMSVVNSDSEGAESLFEYLALFDYSKVQGYFFAYAAEGTAEEVALVRLYDEADKTALRKALEEHKKTRVAQFKQYKPEETELAESAKIIDDGVYVLYIACKNPDEVKKAFTDSEK